MQINKPPSSGTPTTGSGISSPAADRTNRAENALVKLVGQVVSAQVVQSKAVQIAAAQASTQQTGVAARLLQDFGADNKNATSTASPTSASIPPAGNAAQAGNTPPVQTQYQTTLQIGNDRVVVMTDQPLPPGTQLTLKVSSPQLVHMVEQPAATPPIATADIADNLLNTVLRQALPLQQPIANLLANIAGNALLPDNSQLSTAVTNAGATSNPLATKLNLPPNLSPAVVAALKPLLTQIVNSQLTLDSVTDPGALRDAVANSGLFREARLVQWAQTLLKQFPDLPTRVAAVPGTAIPAASASPTATGLDPLAAALQTIAMRTAAAQSGASQVAIAVAAQTVLSTQSASNNAATPVADANGPLDAKQAEILRSATTAAGASSQATLHEAIDTDGTDVDALRKQLLQALGERAQKNQPAFAGAATRTNPTSGSTTSATTVAQTAKTAGMTATNKGIEASVTTNAAVAGLPITPRNGSSPTSTSPIATPSTAASTIANDSKTVLEQLVSLTSQRLLGGKATTSNPISEDQVLAILRQLPMAHAAEPHAATKAKLHDDDQWMLQLLRSSFGALKHLQLQQATNINAAPGAQQASHENPVAPLQIELPMLVAQQWHNVHIEIDRRAPDNGPDAARTERAWRVTLRFELPQQGIIVAQLNLSGEQVNATLWAEKQATCQQLQQQLKELSDRLGKVGARVTTLDVRHGQPPSAKTRIEQRLIDIRT